MEQEGEREEFLPPDPGPAPEEGSPAARPPRDEQATQPLPPPPPQPPPPPPPPHYGNQPAYQPPPSPPYQPPPPGWPVQQPHQQQPQYGQQYGYGYAYPPPEPDNNPAVAGFSMSIAGLTLPFLTAGLSSIISLGLAIAGIVYSRKGIAKVDRGETRKQRGLAQAGFWIGIAGTVISALATIAWIALIAVAASDPDFWDDLEDQDGGSGDNTPAVVSVLVRLATVVLS